MRFRGFVLVVVALAGVGRAEGQTAAPAAARSACEPDQTKPSAADRALLGRNYSDAERLYGAAVAADPASGVAMAGLVRTAVAEGKLPEALTMAMQDAKAHPNDGAVLDALGEVRFRRGEVDEAAMAFNQSQRLDPCSGLTHYDVGRFFNLSGMYKTAQRELDRAHTLAPENQEIARQWRTTHAVPQTPEQRLAMLKTRLENPALTDEQKDGITAAIKGIETREKGDCELVSPVTEAKLPILQITNGSGVNPQDLYAGGLEVQFNGKKRRLEIDTGASGLLLSRSVAKSAGLVPELESKAGGVGDSGTAGVFVTHVDDIKIGKMEFKNCMVRVLEQSGVLDVDGLIGADVFRDYLVTLDFPGREVRIGPLPKRPDDQAGETTSLATSDEDGALVSMADRAKDRYIAPEMKGWSPVFRSQHFLIVPTMIGNAPLKLFLMDTGASRGMISPAAAREVTHVSNDNDARVKGINGKVQNVQVADKVTIGFAGVKQLLPEMQSFDTGSLSKSAGVEISGLIGFPTLRELVISIDYRDNLIHVVYDVSKGYHLR
jgi:predicted aspartyl protease/Tfp pilus assembly protein PilF